MLTLSVSSRMVMWGEAVWANAQDTGSGLRRLGCESQLDQWITIGSWDIYLTTLGSKWGVKRPSRLLGGKQGPWKWRALSAKLTSSGLIQQTVGHPYRVSYLKNHMIKSAFRENTVKMAQRMDWTRGTRGEKSGRRLWRENQELGSGAG